MYALRMRGTQTVIACVGSSLLTVGMLAVLGAGPLTPPTGPVSPTGVSLDQLAAVMQSMQPSPVPGPTLSGAGTATLVFPDRTIIVPLIGYSASRMDQLTSEYYISIAFSAGSVGARIGPPTSVGVAFTLTIAGSDGTTVGPFSAYVYSRQFVNGPCGAGNKAVDVVNCKTAGGIPFPITDPSGTGTF